MTKKYNIMQEKALLYSLQISLQMGNSTRQQQTVYKKKASYKVVSKKAMLKKITKKIAKLLEQFVNNRKRQNQKITVLCSENIFYKKIMPHKPKFIILLSMVIYD